MIAAFSISKLLCSDSVCCATDFPLLCSQLLLQHRCPSDQASELNFLHRLLLLYRRDPLPRLLLCRHCRRRPLWPLAQIHCVLRT